MRHGRCLRWADEVELPDRAKKPTTPRDPRAFADRHRSNRDQPALEGSDSTSHSVRHGAPSDESTSPPMHYISHHTNSSSSNNNSSRNSSSNTSNLNYGHSNSSMAHSAKALYNLDTYSAAAPSAGTAGAAYAHMHTPGGGGGNTSHGGVWYPAADGGRSSSSAAAVALSGAAEGSSRYAGTYEARQVDATNATTHSFDGGRHCNGASASSSEAARARPAASSSRPPSTYTPSNSHETHPYNKQHHHRLSRPWLQRQATHLTTRRGSTARLDLSMLPTTVSRAVPPATLYAYTSAHPAKSVRDEALDVAPDSTATRLAGGRAGGCGDGHASARTVLHF